MTDDPCVSRSLVDRSRCSLRLVGLDGRQIRGPRAFSCGTVSDPAVGSLGLVVRRTRVLDPRTGRHVPKTPWGVLAAAGTKLVLARPGERLTLLDAKTRAQKRLPWPSDFDSLGHPAVDPRGRFVALSFVVPSW